MGTAAGASDPWLGDGRIYPCRRRGGGEVRGRRVTPKCAGARAPGVKFPRQGLIISVFRRNGVRRQIVLVLAEAKAAVDGRDERGYAVHAEVAIEIV